MKYFNKFTIFFLLVLLSFFSSCSVESSKTTTSSGGKGPSNEIVPEEKTTKDKLPKKEIEDKKIVFNINCTQAKELTDELFNKIMPNYKLESVFTKNLFYFIGGMVFEEKIKKISRGLELKEKIIILSKVNDLVYKASIDVNKNHEIYKNEYLSYLATFSNKLKNCNF